MFDDDSIEAFVLRYIFVYPSEQLSYNNQILECLCNVTQAKNQAKIQSETISNHFDLASHLFSHL